MNEVIILIRKELRLEWRNKYALNGILVYIASTIFICYLSFRKINPATWNALFWIILLFASVNALTKSFIQESKYRHNYYYTIASPQAIIFSKIIYNTVLMLLIALVCLIFYSLVFQNPIADFPLYLLSVILGGISFSSVFTFISAIASKAGQQATLMAILSFPVILPLLLLLIRLSKNAMDGLDRSVSYKDLIGICSLNIIVVVVAFILFPYLWRD